MKVIDAPKHKKDWVGKWLLLKTPPNEVRRIEPPTGQPVLIKRRLNAKDTINSGHDVYSWGKVRILSLVWRCKACNSEHENYIRESWIEDGLAVFVEI
jgi:hypothetical protein